MKIVLFCNTCSSSPILFENWFKLPQSRCCGAWPNSIINRYHNFLLLSSFRINDLHNMESVSEHLQ